MRTPRRFVLFGRGLIIALGAVTMRRHGFTFIEIMIVVFIIGILAGLAIPYFKRARERAFTSVCLSGMRVIAEAKEQWAMTSTQSLNTPLGKAQLGPYLKRFPKCPAGDEEYPETAVDDPPLCPNIDVYTNHVLFAN